MKILIHGLGRMGMQIARKLAESGEHEVYGVNRSQEPLDKAAGYGVRPVTDMASVGNLFGKEAVVVWVMLPSDITDMIIMEWTERLPSGSIIVNGANADYRNTQQFSRAVKERGHTLVDIGVSGGVWGYKNGFPMMCGADDPAAYEALVPALDTLSSPGGAHALFGPSGAGHYVKMVHNAIEYGMMQSLGEGYRLLKEGPYADIELGEAGRVWQQHSVITSWLNELSRQALSENPDLTGVSGYVAESGEARWALETAKDLGMELPSIEAAYDVRLRSQQGEVNFATKVVAAQRNKFGGHNLNGEGAA